MHTCAYSIILYYGPPAKIASAGSTTSGIGTVASLAPWNHLSYSIGFVAGKL